MICDNIGVNAAGHLTFAGRDTVELARQYGTPVYLFDEERIRHNCRVYRKALAEHFGDRAKALYAGKAASFAAIVRIIEEEGLGLDVVSCGEIATARKAGFDLSQAFFHGNNKTDADVAYAMDAGVGFFVADNPEEVEAVEAEAARRGIRQKVLLRITPGIDPHTYEAVSTGKVDSKFGAAIGTGAAEKLVARTLGKVHISLMGYHCHVGSQVFGEDVFERAAEVMLRFAADMRDTYAFAPAMIDLGGGIGVRYTDDDPEIRVSEKIAAIADRYHAAAGEFGLPEPMLLLEPGRSIAADAGMTLYTAGSVKRIPGYKNYVSVDGGMADDPRFALYRSRYTVYAAGRMNEENDLACSVVGRCCESGDILQENVRLPGGTCRGDVLAFATTGAYNYSMASNYNRIPRPPVIMLGRESERVAVRRETFEDLCALDM